MTISNEFYLMYDHICCTILILVYIFLEKYKIVENYLLIYIYTLYIYTKCNYNFEDSAIIRLQVT